MLPRLRSLTRVHLLVCVATIVLLSSAIIPLLPDRADASATLARIQARFANPTAAPGSTVKLDVTVSDTTYRSRASVQLRVFNKAGKQVHANSWTNLRLDGGRKSLTMRTSFVVPSNAQDGDVYRAAVDVVGQTALLASDPSLATLEVRVPEQTQGRRARPATSTPASPRPTATPQPPAPTEPPAPAPSDPEPAPTEAPEADDSVLRVNAGGPAFVDSRGLEWWADALFDGGAGYQADVQIEGAPDPQPYQSERWGNFSYEIDVENGYYDLRLMFAEIWFTEPGQRVFNVYVNGAPALIDFDILAEAPRNTALDKVVPVTVEDGKLRLTVASGPADYGKLSGFELLRRAESGEPQPEPSAPQDPEPEPATPPAPEPEPTAPPAPEPEPTTPPAAPEPPANPSQPAPSSIQAMIDAAAPNATVRVPAGTYREKIYITKPITLIGEPGAVIDGENRDRWIVGRAPNVTIEGFTFINSNQPQYHGGLSNDGHDNWTIRNNTFRDAGNAAIDIKQGSGHLIENNHVSRSGNVGIRIESVGSATVRGNVTVENNTKNLDPGWEAGGMKITGNYGGVHNVVIENNEAANNNGPGIWIDVDGHDIEIRNNRVHDNARAGIIYELSFGGKIHGNVVYNNGRGFDAWGFGAGILIQNSSTTEVYDNVVAWNADGISVISQNRGESRWNNVTGNTVRDNTIILNHDGGWNTYALAWLEDWDGVLSHASSNNRGFGNRFWFSTAEGPELRFRWCQEGFWTVANFSQSPGGQNSSYLSNSEKDQILASVGL